MIVHKYGGSSVADAGKILNVARLIGQAKDSGMDVVAVVSAMGDQHFIVALKSNRTAALSYEGKLQGNFSRIDSLDHRRAYLTGPVHHGPAGPQGT